MKTIFLFVVVILLLSCKQNKAESSFEKGNDISTKIIVPTFQNLLDSAKLEGSILVYDLESQTYYSNNFIKSEKGHLPASTFKIPNSIIALETGVIKNDSSIIKWDGEERNLSIWEQDLTFKEAFSVSCVPCYQDIAKEIGVQKMQSYIQKLDYGNIIIDSSSIENFWLIGPSLISQFEQIDFLKRLYLSDLLISSRSEEIIKRMMVLSEKPGNILRGKTGWSIKEDVNNGWFVGYLELKDHVYIFATNIEPSEKFNMDDFPAIRRRITMEALEFLFM